MTPVIWSAFKNVCLDERCGGISCSEVDASWMTENEREPGNRWGVGDGRQKFRNPCPSYVILDTVNLPHTVVRTVNISSPQLTLPLILRLIQTQCRLNSLFST